MCGIAGIIAKDRECVEIAISRMLEMQVHRGPDEGGLELTSLENGLLGLGHRRLSIIDLSAAGHQPMIHPRTGDQIVFNGEIYNFQVLRKELQAAGVKFRGHSDTEVLLHALVEWGPECIDRLEGMYAFGFFDSQKKQLLLARDPLGIKPLYVAFCRGVLVFASEIRAIIASGLVGRQADQRALAGFLAYGAIQEPCTFFEDIRAFPPGCYQIFDIHDGTKVREFPRQRYWDFPPLRNNVSSDEAVFEIQNKLDLSVRDHLVSDVPIGVFLSSGLDSTVVAGIAVKHKAKVRTFTVGFGDNPDMSEANLAGQTARLFGTEHMEVNINCDDAEKMALSWLKSMDQPSIDGLNTYIISRAARSTGIIVALSGLGGDELFGGYNTTFSTVPSISAAITRFNWVPESVWLLISRLATLRQPQAVVEKSADMARTNGDLVKLYLTARRSMSGKQLAMLGISAERVGLSESFMPPEVLADVHLYPRDPVGTVSSLEAMFYMRNTLLRDSDINSMAHSLEIRVPFLDRRLLDYVFSLPGSVRLPSGKADKHLMRQSFGHFFRKELTSQKKRGFSLPLGRWIAGPMRDMCEDALAYLKSLDILRPEGIDSVWKSFIKSGESLRIGRVFGLCVLGLYHRNNRI